MRMARLILVVAAVCAVSALAAKAQVQKQIQIDPDILTKRPVLVPELTLKVLDLPDLAISELRGPATGPDEAGDLELIINLQNFGESPISLKFLDADGQVQPTFEVVHLVPGQSLFDYLSGSTTGDQTPIVKRVFLDAILEPGQKLSRTEAGYSEGANVISISLPNLRDEDVFVSGSHSLVVYLDPAETVIERSRRNNIAAFTWAESFEALSVPETTEMLQLTLPTKEPAKKAAPELRPFE